MSAANTRRAAAELVHRFGAFELVRATNPTGLSCLYLGQRAADGYRWLGVVAQEGDPGDAGDIYPSAAEAETLGKRIVEFLGTDTISAPTPSASTWTIPLAVEDRIALEHLGGVLTGLERNNLTYLSREIQSALDAAYRAVCRQGMTERVPAVSTDKALPIEDFLALHIAKRGVPHEKAKAYLKSAHGQALEQKLLLRILSGRAPLDAIDDELTHELPVILMSGGAT